MSCFAVVPLSQKRVTLFKGPIFWLDELCSLRSVGPEDLGIIKTKTEIYVAEQVIADAKCLYVNLDGVANPEGACIDAIRRIEYVLNGVRGRGIVAPEYLFIFREDRKRKLEKFKHVETYGNGKDNFKLKDGVDKNSISGFFKYLGKATASEPKLIFTIGRFNQAVRRESIEDRIVDLSIAIESLLGAQSEISYQFSLFSSLAATDDINKRKEYFDRFKSLYAARSAIAHGTDSKSLKPVIDDIDAYESCCRNVINYAVFWLAQGKKMNDFSGHLKAMAMGSESYYLPGA